MNRVGAAERVIEATDLLETLVALLVYAFTLRHLVENRRLRLRVVLHKLHVLKNWGEREYKTAIVSLLHNDSIKKGTVKSNFSVQHSGPSKGSENLWPNRNEKARLNTKYFRI